MALHPTTFGFLQPNEEQIATMAKAREATKAYADAIDALVPDGPDKTVMMRQIRDVGMWALASITRLPDGTPRV